ncbi:DgyrCDS488 [Dimorphilus gyrociliatus]|uniref:DgyrCDS488 n=1 Tax=Dimorphilus gyrociliatus TaxID=2664684 RepID=A0A7I8V975_9ANNE|nr:DgyrCDS488 [Dimorphilus gyrociliatus]
MARYSDSINSFELQTVRHNRDSLNDPEHRLAERRYSRGGENEGISRRRKKRANSFASGTLRIRRPVLRQDEIEQVVDEIDNDTPDQPVALQSDQIKEQNVPMSAKREIRRNLERRQTTTRIKKPGWFRRKKYDIQMQWCRFKLWTADQFYTIELWRSHFRTIDGHFGSDVGSYFRLLRWIFSLNLPVFILTFSFLTIPQLIVRNLGNFDDSQESVTCKFEHPFEGPEFLTGGGWFNQTELYYGCYTKEIIQIWKGHKYDMKYAYFFVCVAYYLFTLLRTAYSLQSSYKENFIEAEGEIQAFYSARVFCGWDYRIAHKETALLKHKTLSTLLKESLSKYNERVSNSWKTFFLKTFFRILTNVVSLALIGASGYLVWYISDTQSLKTDNKFLHDMAMPLTISALNFILPFAFSIIASFENYSIPQYALYFTMIRTLLLNAATLGVLVYFWFITVNCDQLEKKDENWLNAAVDCKPCWESFMGEQIYRLVIVDFFFTILFTLFSELIRFLVHKCFKSRIDKPEFDIARNTLNLIYSQSLVWLGTFYSPLLSLIQVIKFFVLFYIKRYSLTLFCRPSSKLWKAAKTQTFFLLFIFVSLLLCVIAVAFSMISLKPSQSCGPYQEFNTTYQVITEPFNKWSGKLNWLKEIIKLITSDVFFFLILTVLSVTVYYTRIIMNAHFEVVRLLKHQLHNEGKDKQFLIGLLQNNSTGSSRHNNSNNSNTRGNYTENNNKSSSNKIHVIQNRHFDRDE